MGSTVACIGRYYRLSELGRPSSGGTIASLGGTTTCSINYYRYHRLALEIVYPCIPYPDRVDEGGQASSSLAVSTRRISAAKLLQSDLATLAQREGGE
ncbi:hypothetical protein GW17_00033788 [Ensete ventricosum]|nr:hypothetical protein GW17_00033788 [Ensete ventricosum]